jgi:hypothetical protein
MFPAGSRSYARFLLTVRLIAIPGGLALAIFDFTLRYWLGVAFWILVLIVVALSWVFGVGNSPKQPPPEDSHEH